MSQGLADISLTSTEEPGRIAEILQRSQLNSWPEVERTGETKKKMPPSPAQCINRYALEVRIQVEVSPGIYATPEDESYSADFVKDTLNLAYPDCTRVFLAEPESVIAFYGKMGSPWAGLSVEQGMEACKILGNNTSWMGDVASWKIRAISLTEVDEMVCGMKILEKESLWKAQLEFCRNFSLFSWVRIPPSPPLQNHLFLWPLLLIQGSMGVDILRFHLHLPSPHLLDR